MPLADLTKVNCVKVESTMATAHTDLEASIRATLANGDELLQVDFIRNSNGQDVVIVYIWEDLTP